jgi:hypothetical protein
MTQSMQQQLFTLLSKLSLPTRIYVTGHSLGAALSQLFTLDLAVSAPAIWTANLNFSSPKVGLGDWQTAYESQPAQQDPAKKTVRVYNYWDYVPSAPPYIWPILEYFHVGRGFRTSFYVKDAWLPYESSRHSLANLQVVLQHAVWLTPQVWIGTFQDRTDSSLTIVSTAPPAGQDVEWSKRAYEEVQFQQAILEGKTV